MLLLDEPTTFLDLRFQVELLDLVRDLADTGGVAIGLVLHDLDQAAAVADELVLLDEGRVRVNGPPAEVLDAELLTEVYGIPVEVDHDPRTGAVRTRPVGRHGPRSPHPITGGHPMTSSLRTGVGPLLAGLAAAAAGRLRHHRAARGAAAAPARGPTGGRRPDRPHRPARPAGHAARPGQPGGRAGVERGRARRVPRA